MEFLNAKKVWHAYDMRYVEKNFDAKITRIFNKNRFSRSMEFELFITFFDVFGYS